jgi:hypothetical protein
MCTKQAMESSLGALGLPKRGPLKYDEQPLSVGRIW